MLMTSAEYREFQRTCRLRVFIAVRTGFGGLLIGTRTLLLHGLPRTGGR